MQDFVNFVMENWRFLTTGVLLLVSLIVAIVRKTKVTIIPETFLLELSDNIMLWVNAAEKAFPESGSGDLKLRYVIERCKSFCLENKCNVSLDFVFALIEKILSTPQKKEINDESR